MCQVRRQVSSSTTAVEKEKENERKQFGATFALADRSISQSNIELFSSPVASLARARKHSSTRQCCAQLAPVCSRAKLAQFVCHLRAKFVVLFYCVLFSEEAAECRRQTRETRSSTTENTNRRRNQSNAKTQRQLLVTFKQQHTSSSCLSFISQIKSDIERSERKCCASRKSRQSI